MEKPLNGGEFERFLDEIVFFQATIIIRMLGTSLKNNVIFILHSVPSLKNCIPR